MQTTARVFFSLFRAALAGVAATLLVTSVAAAQDSAAPASAPAPDAASAAVPAMSCPQPKLPERFSVAQEDMQFLLEQIRAYTDCVRKYVEARQEAANYHNALVRAEAEAGNTAVKEINEYHAQVRAFRDKHDPEKK